MVRHLSPDAVLMTGLSATYYQVDAEAVGAIDDEGNVDWMLLTDLINDDYQLVLTSGPVKSGLLGIDQPMREGTRMFFTTFQTELFETKAAPAAHVGLWWDIEARAYDFAFTLETGRAAFWHSTMAETHRDTMFDNIEKWREMFSDDDRVEEFHSDLVLNLIQRERKLRRNIMTGANEVWFDLVANG